MSNANNLPEQEQPVEVQQSPVIAPPVEKTEDETGGGTGSGGAGELSVSAQEEIKAFHLAQKELADTLFIELAMDRLKEQTIQMNALAAQIEPNIVRTPEVEEVVAPEEGSVSDAQYKKYQEDQLRKKLQQTLQEDESRDADMGFSPGG